VLLRGLITLIGGTMRYRVEDASALLDRMPPGSYIITFWHNRMFLMPHLFRKYWHPRQHTRVAILVSASKDGETLARVLSRFGLVCVRGSTSRRGKGALLELTRLVQNGHDAGITPDGPRGPRFRVQSGVVDLAQLTQALILPVSYVVSRQITFKNAWDHFILPLPFGRCTLRIGQPISVPRDADDRLREDKRLELEQVLQRLSE
jgi:lysophospholipid acyltransferase (LPLAT)-like uncharacterized protein